MDTGIIVTIVLTLFIVGAVTLLEVSSRRKKAAQPGAGQGSIPSSPASAPARQQIKPSHRARQSR